MKRYGIQWTYLMVGSLSNFKKQVQIYYCAALSIVGLYLGSVRYNGQRTTSVLYRVLMIIAIYRGVGMRNPFKYKYDMNWPMFYWNKILCVGRLCSEEFSSLFYSSHIVRYKRDEFNFGNLISLWYEMYTYQIIEKE